VARRTLVLSALLAQHYKGQEDPAEAALVFALRTLAVEEELPAAGASGGGVAALPSGTLISGLPAAVISHCQARIATAHPTLCLSVRLSICLRLPACASARPVHCLSARLSMCLPFQAVHPSVHLPANAFAPSVYAFCLICPSMHLAHVSAHLLACLPTWRCLSVRWYPCICRLVVVGSTQLLRGAPQPNAAPLAVPESTPHA
jgi:hypothetical protein